MRLGAVVTGRRVTAFEHLGALGASALSVRLRPGQNQRAFLGAAKRDHLFGVLGVLDRDSFRTRLDWRGAAEATLDYVMDLVEAGLVDAVAIGHEPDDGWQSGVSDDPLVVPRGGVGSWVLPLAELAEMIALLRERMREVPFPVPLVLGGLCSWRPEVLDTLDLALLDGILIHPYGTAMDPEIAFANYLDGVARVLDQRGLTGRVRLGVGELGRFDQRHGRGEIADWFARALAYLAGRGDVDCCFICCDSDLTLDGFGQFDVKGRAKPSVASIFAVSQRLPAQGPLFAFEGPDPVIETTEPASTPDWGDPHFTPEDIALAMTRADSIANVPDALVDAVRALWPEFDPYLEQFQVSADLSARVALLAALYVATAGRLTPTTEGGSYTRAEQRYGGKLGNLYHGDGWRYRGRGLVRLQGRAAYAEYGQAMGLPLLEEPDMVLEIPVAVGVTALMFQQRDLFDAAARGNWAGVWHGVDPRLHGYGAFLAVIQCLLDTVDARSEPEQNGLGPAALEVALTRLGDPYVSDGDRPGGFDGPGLVVWAYAQVTETPLPVSLAEMVAITQPVSADRAQPGDLVIYEYGDPASGGSRYDHVGLLTDQDTLVLDCRTNTGVGYRPHVRGAIRRYRRVIGQAQPREEREDVVTQDAELTTLRAQLSQMVDRLMAIHARLEQARDMPEAPTDRAPKKDWLDWGTRVRHWREQTNSELDRHFGSLRAFEDDLRALAAPGDKPEAKPEGAADGDPE